jgi:hypothetical protein
MALPELVMTGELRIAEDVIWNELPMLGLLRPKKPPPPTPPPELRAS